MIRASQGNEITKIRTDNLSSVMAVLDPHTPHQLVRDIQSFSHRIEIFWLDGSKPMQAIGDNGNTGRSGYKVPQTVHLKPVFWTREEILFVTGHGPFPSFFNCFYLSDSDSCARGDVGDPIHYVTSCPLTLS
ncbi:hypothetical protein AVEN_261278-1 [Araneus ventricosus]|uniref:Uncharacterized protein n=1 Tax=Araneus ventricosus TaxID=182803 RepID=A0A4Y2GM06_ARAVE|nr:hypothetical protein AVEN_261278-1 [Araneus ventricosus]